MTKDELLKLGITEEQATKVLEGYKDFIPKSRFDEVNTAKKKAEETVAERDKQLEALKKSSGDVEALKKEIEKLQGDNKAAADKYAADLKATKISSAVEKALLSAGAKNYKAVKALLNLEGAELDDNDAVKGLEDQIKKLKEAEDSKFLFAETPNPKGFKPGNNNGNPPKGLTKEDFKKMGYKERVELYNKDKATYEALAAQ